MTVVLQALAETIRSPEVTITGAVALGKVWDKVVGNGRDREFRMHRDRLAQRMDEHSSADAVSFAKIDTSLTQITKQLTTIDERMYDARGE